MNRVTLLDHAGRDPEIRTIGNGEKTAAFSLATTDKWRRKEGGTGESTEWHRIVVFAAAHVTRGDGNRLATQATRLGWLFLPGLVLRPPLMLFGLIAGYFVFLAGIGLFNEVWLPQMRDAGASGGLGPIGFLAMLTLYVMIAYGLMNASFKLIDLLPSAVLDWIGGRGGAGEDGGERVGGAVAGAVARLGHLKLGGRIRAGGPR